MTPGTHRLLRHLWRPSGQLCAPRHPPARAAGRWPGTSTSTAGPSRSPATSPTPPCTRTALRRRSRIRPESPADRGDRLRARRRRVPRRRGEPGHGLPRRGGLHPGAGQHADQDQQPWPDNVRVVEANAPEVLSHQCCRPVPSRSCGSSSGPVAQVPPPQAPRPPPAFADLAARALKPGGLSGVSRPTGPTMPSTCARSWPARPTSRTCTTTTQRRRGPLTRCGNPASSPCGRGPGQGGPRTGEHRTHRPERGRRRDGRLAPRFDGRILTSFENKAHDAGRLIFDLSYRRR